MVPKTGSPVALVIYRHKVHEQHVVGHGIHSKKLHLERGEHSSGGWGKEVRSPQVGEYRTALHFNVSSEAASSSALPSGLSISCFLSSLTSSRPLSNPGQGSNRSGLRSLSETQKWLTRCLPSCRIPKPVLSSLLTQTALPQEFWNFLDLASVSSRIPKIGAPGLVSPPQSLPGFVPQSERIPGSNKVKPVL